MNFSESVAIITGASSGIGRSCAMALDKAGTRLILVGRDSLRLEAVAAECNGATIQLIGDIGEPETSKKALDLALNNFGRLDILLANAGIYLPEKGWEVDATEVDSIVRTNVLGVMHSVHAVLPHFIEQKKGDIVVTSSISGHQVIPKESIYSATKHAVQAFVHGTRQQLVDTGVRLGSIAPGVVLNELWGVSEASPQVSADVAAGKAMYSEDVADAVMYMLQLPQRITIRDLVILPTNQSR